MQFLQPANGEVIGKQKEILLRAWVIGKQKMQFLQPMMLLAIGASLLLLTGAVASVNGITYQLNIKKELAQLITREQGEPLKEAIGEVVYGVLSLSSSQRRQDVLMVLKVGPALACGCTVVIKPSELTPLTALAAAELAVQSGIPPGVLNVVMGDASKIGNSLPESPQVRKITFTGSTAVGKKLKAGAAETVKKISLELGGNAPFIIFDDADLEVALKASVAPFGGFKQSGLGREGSKYRLDEFLEERNRSMNRLNQP